MNDTALSGNAVIIIVGGIMDIKKIAVIGAGTMGGGIAQVAAQSGCEVILAATKEEHARAGFENKEKNKILSSIKTTASMEDCKDAGLVIEAVVEKEDMKKQVFKELDNICGKETVFATKMVAGGKLGRKSGEGFYGYR